jgi:hypothetical protein
VRTLSVKKIPLIPRRTSSPVSIGRSNRTGCAKWTQHFRAFVLHREVNGLLSERFRGKPQASSPDFPFGSPFKENTPNLIQSAARLGAGQFDTRKSASRLLSNWCRPSVASPQPSCRILRIPNGAPCTQCGDRRPFPCLIQNKAAVLTNGEIFLCSRIRENSVRFRGRHPNSHESGYSQHTPLTV